jgi:peroxiredoxin
MRSIVWGWLIVMLAASWAWAQVEPKAGGATPPGVANTRSTPVGTLSLTGHVFPGDDAPGFSLTSSRGLDRSLHSLKGDWVVLLFLPRKNDFIAFRDLSDEFAKLPARLVGITYENPQSLKTLDDRERLGFELLGDATGEVSASYGLWDALANTTRPGMIVVDRKGMVRLVVSGQALPPEQVISLTRITIEGS